MKLVLTHLTALLFSSLAAVHAADTFLVENGQPRAEIIISDKPQRSTRLAAQELQDQIAKISGARLPIVTQASGKAVKIFVGASAQSPVKADGLKDVAIWTQKKDSPGELYGDIHSARIRVTPQSR